MCFLWPLVPSKTSHSTGPYPIFQYDEYLWLCLSTGEDHQNGQAVRSLRKLSRELRQQKWRSSPSSSPKALSTLTASLRTLSSMQRTLSKSSPAPWRFSRPKDPTSGALLRFSIGTMWGLTWLSFPTSSRPRALTWCLTPCILPILHWQTSSSSLRWKSTPLVDVEDCEGGQGRIGEGDKEDGQEKLWRGLQKVGKEVEEPHWIWRRLCHHRQLNSTSTCYCTRAYPIRAAGTEL